MSGKKEENSIRVVSTSWKLSDYLGQIRCRFGSFRMRYSVEPGLYEVGHPDIHSPVFVSANYKLSFDILRRNLEGIDGYILVLDTKGINVWCAAGKGEFGTEELVHRITETGLSKVIVHKKLIVPQLGAPGIHAHVVRKRSGFRVIYGPVYAKDIPQFLRNGYRATRDMRKVQFRFLDRLILTPIEITQSWKPLLIFSIAALIFFGLRPSGILFRDTINGGYPFLIYTVAALFSGGFITPLLLPIIPFRAFSLKGYVIGLIVITVCFFYFENLQYNDIYMKSLIFLFFPALSSFIALNFTGATPYTNISGVQKELKITIPIYIIGAGISFSLFIVFKLRQLELL